MAQAAEQDLSAQMVQLWTNFAYSSNPSVGPSTPRQGWPAYSFIDRTGTGSGDVLLRMRVDGGKANISAQTGLKDSICDFWERSGAVPQEPPPPPPASPCQLEMFNHSSSLCQNGTDYKVVNIPNPQPPVPGKGPGLLCCNVRSPLPRMLSTLYS